MPYIKKNVRPLYDARITEIVEMLQVADNVDGETNYVISRIVAGAFKPKTGWRYAALARAYGCFLSAAAEFYRRLLSQYEDGAIKSSGDIPEYE